MILDVGHGPGCISISACMWRCFEDCVGRIVWGGVGGEVVSVCQLFPRGQISLISTCNFNILKYRLFDVMFLAYVTVRGKRDHLGNFFKIELLLPQGRVGFELQNALHI